ncbi:SRPBCC family protein [Natronomonas sp. F2-12]|jgi:carbon monoxide dehydrogenase subunit G|uniref:SRPBCC family protein n=1 Tax=Natronomonas aquatica TaxID=2841590 RepID=A0A9R1CQA1_9EURY|nr:SRPBCC family protein [Natronomonas aquatica]MCQ4333068.1 SRPBCC family protein [Natronomonas aquatica]
MTARVERVFEIAAPPEEVWAVISDPEQRARSISVVDTFETTGERTAVWHVSLPIPGLNRTIRVETEDVEIDPPAYVRFVGRSKAMNVQGEHVLESTNGGTHITNRFTVDGRLPGVERYFERKLDGEMANLEATIRDELDA